jgi:hypothetical protein
MNPCHPRPPAPRPRPNPTTPASSGRGPEAAPGVSFTCRRCSAGGVGPCAGVRGSGLPWAPFFRAPPGPGHTQNTPRFERPAIHLAHLPTCEEDRGAFGPPLQHAERGLRDQAPAMQRRALSKLAGVLGASGRAGGAAQPGSGAAAALAAPPAAAAARGAPAYYPAAPGPASAPLPLRAFSAAASPASATAKSTANVPLGHHDSDLSSVACHIGLGRRRDLTMREDLGLWKNGGTRIKLADVFRVRGGAAGRGGGAADLRGAGARRMTTRRPRPSHAPTQPARPAGRQDPAGRLPGRQGLHRKAHPGLRCGGARAGRAGAGRRERASSPRPRGGGASG